jgi:hypothetical protein
VADPRSGRLVVLVNAAVSLGCWAARAGGCVVVDSREWLVEVVSGEVPLEQSGDLAVAFSERE